MPHVVIPVLNEALALPDLLAAMPPGYTAVVADNGSNWYVSGVSDTRWDPAIFDAFRQVHGGDFEVVKMGPVTTP